MESTFDWKAHLTACMASTEFCCVATVDAAGVWANPVYFAWDDAMNLYFISQPHSRHMRNIGADGRVAVSIYSTQQSTFDDVAGIQLDGHAEVLTDRATVEKAHATYYGRKYPSGVNENGKTEDTYMHNPEWQFVKITPSHIFYFDTRFFNEERQEVPREIFGA